MNPKRLRAVDYLRVSTEEQTKGYGIAASAKRTTRHMAGKGWEHVGTFKDEGVPGSLPWQEREDMARLMEQAQMAPRPFDLVTVSETRAIGRTDRVFWRWVWELEDLGVFVAVADKDIDNTTEDGRAAMREEANYAFKEYARIKTRTQSGIQEKAEAGGCTGNRVRFGYRIENKGIKGASRLVPDVCDCAGDCDAYHEAVVARRAYQLLVVRCMNRDTAALRLNAEGLVTRSGKPWTGANLAARMLTLTGEPFVIFRNPARVALDADGHPAIGETVRIELEPVFSDEERFRLKAALTRRTYSKRSSEPYPLSGRLASPCGGHYSGQNRDYVSGAQRQYRCTGRVREYAGAELCDCPNLDASLVEGWVWEAVCHLLADPARLRGMAAEWVNKARSSEEDHAARIKTLDDKVTVQQAAMSAVMGAAAKQAVMDGRDPETAIAEALRPLQAELDQLQAQRSEAAAWQAEQEQAEQRARDLDVLAETARTRLHSLDAARQGEVVALMDIRVKVTGFKGGDGTARCPLGAWFRDRSREVPDLTDEAWRLAEPVLAASVRRRRANALPHRTVLEAMLHKARTGLPWGSLPAEYGKASGLRTRYHRWVDLGVWDQVMDKLAGLPGQAPPGSALAVPTLEVAGRVDSRLLVGVTGDSSGTPTKTSVPQVPIKFRIELAA